ncbi:uncharacterized protein LOC121768094 isoform X2 [Salvia splendens]|uniref:uncharacterized protein LOC121768094 isoform X2 n=1 Tax=Salvia splendens TaxID=180675 RepID=UPI001C27943D|nr:uncharacterized protein LOC121768094 isoform X2 [Salvia splendens]
MDTLIFTYVGRGVFQIIRTSSMTGCPPLYDYDGALWPIPETDVVPDVDTTSDDYETSDGESDAEDDGTKGIWREQRDLNDHPSFTIAFNETSIKRTLEIPVGFWKQFVRESALDNEAYFTIGGRTWEIWLSKRNEVVVRRP